VPVKTRDRKRWERELTDHMRRHAADLKEVSRPRTQRPRAQRSRDQTGVWMTAPRLILWTLTVVIITSVGWAVGLYVF
jgi:hypothetical protein